MRVTASAKFVPGEKEQLRVTNESPLIGAAVLIIAFGVFVSVLERIRHPPATPMITFTGLAGVYPDCAPPWSAFAGCIFRA